MICHPLRGICLLLNLVGSHLDLREFMSPSLTKELLPDSTRIIYKPELDRTIREDALPMVAYGTKGFKFIPIHGLNTSPGTLTKLDGRVAFIVSTTSEALTSELSFEIGAAIMAYSDELKGSSCIVNAVEVSEIACDEKQYYVATVSADLDLRLPVWKTEEIECILREIRLAWTAK